MKTPKHKPDPRLRKSHAHPDKTKYKRPKGSDEWGDHIDSMPHLVEINWDELPDKAGEPK